MSIIKYYSNLLFHVLAVSFIAIPYTGHSQSARPSSREFTYKLGTPYQVIDAPEKYYFNQGTEIISVKIEKKDIRIQKFDGKSLRQLHVREVTDMSDKYVHEGFGEVPGSVLFFYSLYDKSAKKEQLYSRSIDYKTGTFAAKPQLLITADDKIAGTLAKTSKFGYGMEVTDKFDFHISADSSKLLVQYRLKPEVKDDSKNFDVIGLTVFNYNQEFSKMWGKEVKMPYTEKKMDILDYTVDKQGNAYILSKVFSDNTTKNQDRDKLANYRFEVIKVDAATQQPKGIKIDLEGKFVTDAILWETADGYLTVSGYYNFKNKEKELNAVEGVFHCKLTPEGALSDLWVYDIPLELINENVSKKTASKNEKAEDKDEGGAGFANLDLDRVVRFDDGSYLLIGEQFKVITSTHTTSSGTRTTTSYYYENMLLTRLHADGKLAWMKKMPKKQKGGTAPGGMSYKYFRSGDNHYVLFLDHVKNLDLPKDKVPYTHADGAGGYLTAYKINNSTGEASRISIFDTRDVNGTEVFQFKPSRLIQISENEFVLEVYKKSKEDVLIKITGKGGVSE